MKLSLFSIIFLIFLTDLCDTFSQLMLKSSINQLNLHVNTVKKVINLMLRLIKTPLVLVGFSFSTLSLAVWLFVLSKSDLNFAYSLDSMKYILVAIASMLFLKEKIGFIRWLGITSVVCGIVLVTMG